MGQKYGQGIVGLNYSTIYLIMSLLLEACTV
jgi:hypothetical protein